MKVSLNWLKEYAKIELPVEKVVEKIGAQLGAVEEVIDIGSKYRGIVIAKVVSCEKHSDADKLSVCLIDDGGVVKGVKRNEKGLVEVVCGAPNVREGLLVAWLPPGTTVPSSIDKEPFVLEARAIRGVVSNGMLASASELALSDDHSGILELNALDGKPGADFAATYYLNDHVIDIENKMFTHRPDLFGIIGVAREVAGIQNLPFESPKWYADGDKQTLRADERSVKLTIKNEIPKLVPRFMAIPLRLPNNGPSPFWLQTYLSRVGLRPINLAVDVTNYIMHLTGQPLHAYDADKLPTPGSLEARLSKKGDILKLLNGKELSLQNSETILITSGNVPVGVGGLMGGAGTETDENTRNIILEAATFDMYTIRRSAMEYGLFTDAGTRFTKGQSPLQNDRAIAKAVELLRQFVDAQVTGEVADIHKTLSEPQTVRVEPSFINDRLGLNLSPKKITDLLENVEFKVRPIGKQLAIRAPFWRTDIELPEDVVEEVGRLYGYDKLPIELPSRSIKPTKLDELFDFKSQLRDILSKAGANEVLTYSFVHEELLTKAGQNPKNAFKLSNALSPDLQYYRQSLVPSLLDKVHANIKAGFDEFALFEINQTHAKDLLDEDGLPIEEYRLGLVITTADKKHIDGAAYYSARQYLDQVLWELGIEAIFEPATIHEPKMEVGKAALAPFERSRAAYIKTKDGKLLGEIGEFSAPVRRNFKLPRFAAGFELDVIRLLEARRTSPGYMPISRFPKVEQDMTLRIKDGLSYQELDQAIADAMLDKSGAATLRISRLPLSIFQKDDETHKNISYRFTITSFERTMTAGEVNTLLNTIAEDVRSLIGAERI